jgi:DNA mismatch repair protein MutL
MRWLIDALSKTTVPTNCPHRRPVILRFSLREIEKNFGCA